ncbi:nuclease-related domain-containing protein [Aquibacillus kalidii]|uniref:nuclease-related domain-containing protein n=1 Tax=Aquibacillus kalidii TaxID=2762597 RepID=UPI001648D5B6|nr:nuclease-related domain-containing protein [Aquibacillus kalidii]
MFNFFKKKTKQPEEKVEVKKNSTNQTSSRSKEELAEVKGQIGEHKIDIQLSQFPKEYKYFNDLMIKNPKSKTGFSQIDHVVITPYGIFVIETKNYQGTIYGGKDRKTWLVNGKFKFMNPFYQNYGHVEALKQLLDNKHEESFISMVSFTKRCTFKIGVELRKIQSNEIIVYDIELSDFIQRKVNVQKMLYKEPLLSEADIHQIYQSIANANVEDKTIREQHNDSIKNATSKQKSKTATCVVCDKPVSDKVKTYCLSNKKFSGKVYCFEHQKSV